MNNNQYNQICLGNDVRKNLIELHASLKSEEQAAAFRKQLGGDCSVLAALLSDEDPKVRKNAALVLGDLKDESVLPALLDAYEKEQTRFIRADLVKAIGMAGLREAPPILTETQKQLQSLTPDPAEQKHVDAELRQLRLVLSKFEEKERHVFVDPGKKTDVILLTNRNLREVTLRQVKAESIRSLGAGYRLHGAVLSEILPVRTYSELLFPIPGLTEVGGSPEQIGEQLSGAHIRQMLDRMHEGSGSYSYRVSLKTSDKAGREGEWIRKLCASLDRRQDGLVNDPSGYEVEIRLLRRKEGTFVPCLKLFTLKDERFSYRKNFTARSIAPVNAALTAQAALPWLREDARILDPFCGVGTMLIERDKALRARALFGVDTDGQAVLGGRENAHLAGREVCFINRNILDFSHRHLFDEVITDMPEPAAEERSGGASTAGTTSGLCRQFLSHIKSLIRREAVLILYTPAPGLVRACAAAEGGFTVEEQLIVNDRSGTGIIILRYIGQTCF